PPAEIPAMYKGSPATRLAPWLVSVPSPSWPYWLPPQAHTEVSAEMPSVAVATQWSTPAEMPVAWDKPGTWTGTSLKGASKLPSCALSSQPQAHTVPFERSARLNP